MRLTRGQVSRSILAEPAAVRQSPVHDTADDITTGAGALQLEPFSNWRSVFWLAGVTVQWHLIPRRGHESASYAVMMAWQTITIRWRIGIAEADPDQSRARFVLEP